MSDPRQHTAIEGTTEYMYAKDLFGETLTLDENVLDG